jgi:hypothetical protein
MRKKAKQRETAAAMREALETAKSGGQIKEEWLAIRKKAGRKINPETAEIMFEYGYALDPYGIGSRFSQAYQQLQRNYFARSPGSDIWVFFYDLPTATRHALWEKHGAKIAFRLQDRLQDRPDKETRVLQREQSAKLFREMIKVMEHLYDWLDCGKSFEEIEIMIDIPAAAGRIPEKLREVSHGALEIIRSARKEGADRSEVITHIQETARALCEITERDGWR